MVNFEGKRVAVALSGGVDSSTALYLLQQEGYEVCGLTLINHDNSFIDMAAKVCDTLGVDFYYYDIKSIFKDKVVSYFLDTYSKGKTPNPCVYCNKVVKWGEMYQYAKTKLNCDYIATGHYAIIEKLGNEYKLKKSKDRLKDQTYMLVNLNQEDLSHTIFPLGYYEKQEVRKIAKENNLPAAEAPESQDVCFIAKEEKTHEYLENRLGKLPGNIIDCSSGKIIGEHTGVYNFTVGQRKGIKIAYPYPLYVISIDVENNVVYVGSKEDTESNNLIAESVNWISQQPPEDKFYALTKIRYGSKPKLSYVQLIDNNSVTVDFEDPQSAITPGQVAAFYSLDNQYLLGGGYIQ